MRSLIVATLLASVALTTGADAQSSGAQAGVEGRVDRLEREMRAVQRTVFPGGNRSLSPDIVAPVSTTPLPGTPANGAVADLDIRVATLTGQIEQNQYRVRQMEDAFTAYKRTTDARLAALEQGASTPGSIGAAPAANPGPVTRPTPRPSATPSAGTTTPTRTDPSRTDPSRGGRVAAVERTTTGDAGEDAYLYGYRLWDAKLYPEAQAQLKDTVAKYPRHRRASFAQNLLGRAYLDAGQPSLASVTFYDSFKKYPDGERAPDSLYYLGQALVKLNKPADACKVYAELDASYGTKISPELKARAAQGRIDAKCK